MNEATRQPAWRPAVDRSFGDRGFRTEVVGDQCGDDARSGARFCNRRAYMESLRSTGKMSNIISPLMVVADRFLIANVLGAAVVAYYTIPAEFMIRLLILPAAITS